MCDRTEARNTRRSFLHSKNERRARLARGEYSGIHILPELILSGDASSAGNEPGMEEAGDEDTERKT